MAKRGKPYNLVPKTPESMIRQDFFLEPEHVAYLNKITTNTTYSKGEIVRKAMDLFISKNPADEVIKEYKTSIKPK